MGQVAYRANLSSATFPMTIADGGRTVIIPGSDNNFDRRVDPTGSQLDAGIPQALYMENVFPTVNGYQSVGWINPVLGMTLAAGTLIWRKFDVKSLSGATISSALLFQTNAGVLTSGADGRGTVTVVGGAPSNPATLTSAVVNNICYLYDSGSSRLYTVTGGFSLTLTEVTASVTPLGFFTSQGIIAICGSSNYLIAVALTTVFWSSTTTPTDFVSSLVSGAGQINPNDLIGGILTARQAAAGFYLYTSGSVNYAQYTGNSRYPFKFTPVKNVNGINTQTDADTGKFISGDVDSIGQIIVDKNNSIKFIEQNQAKDGMIEAANFLFTTNTQELLNYTTNVFTSQVCRTLYSSIFLYYNRYVFISINDSITATGTLRQYTHVIVFDIALNRYGKIKVTHDFISEVSVGFETAGINSKILPVFIDGVAGTVKYLNFDIYGTLLPTNATYEAMQGVLLLGKFQYARSRFLKLEEIEIEGPQNTSIVATPNFSCSLFPSLDGRNFGAAVPLTASYLSGGVAKFPCHQTAQNISVLLKGAFNVNTLQLRFTPAGNR